MQLPVNYGVYELFRWAIAFLWATIICLSIVTTPVFAQEKEREEKEREEKGDLDVSVKVRGIDDELGDNAKAFLTIRKKTRKQDTSNMTADDLNRWHALATSEIQQSLQPFGYYNVLVEPTLKQESDYEWEALYQVTKGIRSRWRKISVDAKDLPEELNYLRKEGLPRRDSSVNHQKYAAYKSRWLARLLEAGFLDARFASASFVVDVANNAVDLDWKIEVGPRYLFGDIRIDQTILRDALVNRYHTIIPGAPFSTNALIDLQLGLNSSNYFESVALDIRKEEAVGLRVPVVVRTVPRKRKRFNAGLGFGTDTGPRVTAGVDSRRVNKRGHQYRLNTRVSTVASSLQFEYDIPIKDVAKDRWRLYAEVERSDIGDADATQFSIGAAKEDDWGRFRRRLFFNAERTNFEFGDEGSQNATVVYPGITLSYDRLDDPQFVRKGFSVAVTLQGGLDFLGSSTTFTRAAFNGRGILPLGKRGRLLGAVNAGYVEAKDFLALPPSQRLFLGGDRSVRGYGFQTISPENAAGDDIGGSRSFALSLETDYQVSKSWGVAAFVDIGDVSDGAPTDFRTGLGIGARYRSPVGMIRLDLAHPFDDPDSAVRVHLSIGSDL